MALVTDTEVLLLLVLLFVVLLVAVILAFTLRASRRELRQARQRMDGMIDLSEDLAAFRLKRIDREIELLAPDLQRAGSRRR